MKRIPCPYCNHDPLKHEVKLVGNPDDPELGERPTVCCTDCLGGICGDDRG